MNPTTIIILILILVCLLVIIGIFFYIRGKLRNLSQEVFGTTNIIEGFKNQEIEYSTTPKSVSSMDSVIIPKINKDFPTLNVEELKSSARKSITTYYDSLNKKKYLPIAKINSSLETKIKDQINNLSKDEKYTNLKFHRTVISSYTNEKGLCKITVQSSLEYEKETSKNKKLTQDRINVDFIYIYDDTLVKDAQGVSLNCPNCGAPIKKLGIKTCPYCDTGLVEFTSKVWQISDIYKY